MRFCLLLSPFEAFTQEISALLRRWLRVRVPPNPLPQNPQNQGLDRRAVGLVELAQVEAIHPAAELFEQTRPVRTRLCVSGVGVRNDSNLAPPEERNRVRMNRLHRGAKQRDGLPRM